MAVSSQVVTSQLPAAFETYYKEGAEGSKGLIPQAFQLYGQGTPEAFQKQYLGPLQAAGLAGAGRVAGLSPAQQQLGTQIGQLGTPTQFAAGTSALQQGVGGLAGLLNQQAQAVNAPSLTAFQLEVFQIPLGLLKPSSTCLRSCKMSFRYNKEKQLKMHRKHS
jgi:hypothetical protein